MYIYISVEMVLERMKEDGPKKIQFGEMFMKICNTSLTDIDEGYKNCP